MPRTGAQRKKANRQNRRKRGGAVGGGRVDELGTKPSVSVTVPRGVQSQSKQWLRGTDAVAIASGIFNFASSGTPLITLSTWLTNSGNWSTLTNVYDEFRPLRVRMKYTPSNKYVAVFNFPFLLAYDNDGDLIAGASVAQVAQYRTSKQVSSSDEFEICYEWSPPATDTWLNIAVPTTWKPQLLAIPTVALGSVVQATGSILYEIEVVFRGVR